MDIYLVRKQPALLRSHTIVISSQRPSVCDELQLPSFSAIVASGLVLWQGTMEVAAANSSGGGAPDLERVLLKLRVQDMLFRTILGKTNTDTEMGAWKIEGGGNPVFSKN